jgi:acetylglutamate kinase
MNDKKKPTKPSAKKGLLDKTIEGVDYEVLQDIVRAEILSEALPFIKDFAGETFVIKYGGSAIGQNAGFETFIKNVCLLKSVGINIVIVHGGGPQISRMLEKLNIKTEFVDGLRVTNAQTIEIVEAVLCGQINKFIVEKISKHGCRAVGVCGKDYDLMKAERLSATYKKNNNPNSKIEELVNLGFVGKPSFVNPEFFSMVDELDFIPVIAPIASGDDGYTYNMNADTVAGAVAVAISAKKLILLSDTNGILDDAGKTISSIKYSEAMSLVTKGIVSGGMIPKLETAVAAVENGVGSAHIINGLSPHALLIEVLTKSGGGTMIVE